MKTQKSIETDMGRRIKKLRMSLGLSQREFSDYLGIANNTLSKYESNDRTPGLEILIKLKKLFFIDLNWLIAGVGNMFAFEESHLKDVDSFRKLSHYFSEMSTLLKQALPDNTPALDKKSS
jgi:transcriptional regulator with XRE-family HTH domain